jgi:hypothetical protein
VAQINAWTSAVIRVLKKHNIHPRRAARKLYLSPAHAEQCLFFPSITWTCLQNGGKMSFFPTKNHSGIISNDFIMNFPFDIFHFPVYYL